MSFLSKIFGIFKISFLKKNAGKVIPVLLLFLSLGAAYYYFVYKPVKDKDMFVNLYKEILIIRFILPDTTKANPEIAKLLKEKGLTERDFGSLYNYYASKPEYFLIMLDSAKMRAERELIEKNKKGLIK